ncbi:MAG: group I intron-associated PD-(D/E)XK endonuclease [bacterium]
MVVLDNGDVVKLQVKYAALQDNGTVEVRFRRNWIDKHGVHSEPYGTKEFDYYAIYCPEKEAILYVPNNKNCPKAIRFDKPANNQQKSVRWANDYLELKRESSETIRHTPEMVKT